MNKIFIISFFLVLTLLSFTSSAQQISPVVINTAGTTFSSSGAILTFNIGEAAITTISGTNNGITQGFLQPEIFTSSLNDITQKIKTSLFPNPSKDIVQINGLPTAETFRAKLIDSFGRTVYDVQLQNNSFSIADQSDGLFQLLIYNSKQELVSRTPIVKIN